MIIAFNIALNFKPYLYFQKIILLMSKIKFLIHETILRFYINLVLTDISYFQYISVFSLELILYFEQIYITIFCVYHFVYQPYNTQA
jgi:hypothetical protein